MCFGVSRSRKYWRLCSTRFVKKRWQSSPNLSGAASVAISEHDWSRAKALVKELPNVDETDRVLRDELLGRIARGRAPGGSPSERILSG